MNDKINDEGRKKNILVVEDESIVSLDIERSLKKMGYRVPTIVSRGEDAILCAALLKPDLVLMDIRLNGNTDGIAAAKEIKNRFNIPVIFLTAFADDETLSRAKEADAYWYLIKPFEEVELSTAIDIVLLKHKRLCDKEAAREARLRINDEHLKMFLDSIYDYAVFTTDVDGVIQSWNTGSTRILGYGPEVIGKKVKMFYPKDESSDAEEVARTEAIKKGKHVEERWMIKSDGSKLWSEVATVIIYDKEGKPAGFGKVLHDLNIRKHQEDQLHSFF